MSKGLEALERIKKQHYVDGRLPLIDRVRLDIIEKELKALEIIRNKSVKISQIKTCLDLYSYNSCLNMYDKPITKEEYDLLKEVLL